MQLAKEKIHGRLECRTVFLYLQIALSKQKREEANLKQKVFTSGLVMCLLGVGDVLLQLLLPAGSLAPSSKGENTIG